MKFEPDCSEVRVAELARELAARLRAGDILLLEGPMGAGKSTFARALLEALGVSRGGEGSPTFAIAHEYRTPAHGVVLHADFYRLKSDEEVDETGVSSAIWERELLCLIEWSSLFPGFVEQVRRTAPGRIIEVELGFSAQGDRRGVRISGAGQLGA